MTRALPNSEKGFSGIHLPTSGPLPMGGGNPESGFANFFNQYADAYASLHDNGTTERPSYLIANSLWACTDPGTKKKSIYQYDGRRDVLVWEMDAEGNLLVGGRSITSLAAPGYQIFDIPGIYDFIAPHTGWYKVIVTGAGGGAGAAAHYTAGYEAASAGANAGGTAIGWVYLQKGERVLVTVGRGGKGVVWANNWGLTGETGEASSFGTHLTATGGTGSPTTSQVPSLAHAQYFNSTNTGMGLGGLINLLGGYGLNPVARIPSSASSTIFPGLGGPSFWSPGGQVGVNTTALNTPHGKKGKHGSGGGGARASGGAFTGNGGDGGDGAILVEW